MTEPPRIEQRGAGKATLDLRALGVRASDVRPVKRQLREVFTRSERRRFSGGADWPPLAPATVERKAAAGLDPRILRATNALYRSLAEGGRGSVEEAGPGHVAFGTSLHYARFAEHGTKTAPKRELVELRPSEVSEMTRIVGKHITEGER